MAKILIADDHPVFLSGLETLLAAAGHEMLSCARDAVEALAKLRECSADLLVTDVSMPEGGGLRLLRDIRAGGSSLPVIFLTVGIEWQRIIEAMTLGVNGIVLKTSDPQDLLTCINAVAVGDDWFDDTVLAAVRGENDRRHDLADLTRREIQIAMLGGEGLRNREIAARLGVSEGTVKIHLNRIFSKLDIESRAELVLLMNRKAA
jgi:two-component system nitrate/nitrite response regulator NarP